MEYILRYTIMSRPFLKKVGFFFFMITEKVNAHSDMACFAFSITKTEMSIQYER